MNDQNYKKAQTCLSDAYNIILNMQMVDNVIKDSLLKDIRNVENTLFELKNYRLKYRLKPLNP